MSGARLMKLADDYQAAIAASAAADAAVDVAHEQLTRAGVDAYAAAESLHEARHALLAAAEAPSVNECPGCGQVGRYDGRVLVGGRGVYSCACGTNWQNLDEKPTNKGAPLP